MIHEEVTVKSDKIYEGKVINLKVDTVELPDKRYSKREIVEHSGGVGIIAITEEDNIVLVKQYRKAIGKTILEIPAGKLELMEEPKGTAKRELEEETGYISDELKYLTEFYPTPGYCTEKIHIFLAKNLRSGVQNLDKNEYLDVIELPFNDAYDKVMSGEIIDGKTIVGILLMKQERDFNEK